MSEIKYLQGHAPNKGDGSKEHPFNSFYQAEKSAWKTLIILPSTTVINGSIILKSGQNIEGKQRDKALFRNENKRINNGDVIVCNGNNKISYITIVSAYRCGIDALNSEDLYVECCAINNCNAAQNYYHSDYLNQPDEFDRLPFASISFHGGPTIAPGDGLQPLNTKNGTFTLLNTDFDGFIHAVTVGSGDIITKGYVSETYQRIYKISDCNFTNPFPFNPMASIPFLLNGIIITPGGGGIISGYIKRCVFTNFSNIITNNISHDTLKGIRTALAHKEQNKLIPYALPITIISIISSTLFPGRGNATFLRNVISKCIINDSGARGIYIEPQSYSKGTNTEFIIKKNVIKNYNKFALSYSGPTLIEINTVPAIQIDIGSFGTIGSIIKYDVRDNSIIDPDGRAGGILLRNLGSTSKIINYIKRNTIIGPSTGIEILSYKTEDSAPGNPNGFVYIVNNKFNNNDSVIIVAGDGNKIWNKLNVKIENNCFENSGARNSPPLSDNASYYGGAIIYGGWTNNALILSGLGGYTLGEDVTVDLGGGSLNSVGNNNFIKTLGPDTWVDQDLYLSAKMNWFLRSRPKSSGPGKTDFNPFLNSPSSSCNDNNK